MKLRLPNSGNIVSIVAGCIGLLAAVLVGTGEFLLHFDPMARYAGGYVFWVYAEPCGLILTFLGSGGRNAATIFSLR